MDGYLVSVYDGETEVSVDEDTGNGKMSYMYQMADAKTYKVCVTAYNEAREEEEKAVVVLARIEPVVLALVISAWNHRPSILILCPIPRQLLPSKQFACNSYCERL